MDIAHALKPALMVLLLPPAPPILLVLVSTFLIRRRPRFARAALLLGCVLIWLCTCEGTAQWLNRHLLHTPPALEAKALADLMNENKQSGGMAVLVLGAGVRSYVPEYLGSSLQPLTLDRLRYGVWLARKLDAPLGFTGGIGWGARSRHFSEASVVERVAREEFGLPLRWAESRARDTRENAAYSLPMLKADGIHKLVLVTHDQHMPRAMQAFQEVAKDLQAQDGKPLEIVTAPVGLVADGMSEMLDWCPTEEGFGDVRYAVYEWIGRLAGH